MDHLQALIFDVDGTLAETEREGHLPAFNAAFAEAGLDWYWDEARYGRLLAITGGKERMTYHAWQADPATAARPDFEALIQHLHATKTAHYVRLVQSGKVRLRPGVRELIEQAREVGWRLAIATTTTRINVDTLLAATLGPEAIDWFEVIGAGDIVPRKKPAPDIYHWVLSRLGLAPEAALAIEDSANGLLAARGAGIPCVITPNPYTAGEDFSGACLVVPDLRDFYLR